jgi:hypothetical protein
MIDNGHRSSFAESSKIVKQNEPEMDYLFMATHKEVETS